MKEKGRLGEGRRERERESLGTKQTKEKGGERKLRRLWYHNRDRANMARFFMYVFASSVVASLLFAYTYGEKHYVSVE